MVKVRVGPRTHSHVSDLRLSVSGVSQASNAAGHGHGGSSPSRTRAYIHALGDCVRLLEQLLQNVPWLHVAAAASPGDDGEPVTDPGVEIGDVVLAGGQDPAIMVGP